MPQPGVTFLTTSHYPPICQRSPAAGAAVSPSSGHRDTKPLAASVRIRAPLSVKPVTGMRDVHPLEGAPCNWTLKGPLYHSTIETDPLPAVVASCQWGMLTDILQLCSIQSCASEERSFRCQSAHSNLTVVAAQRRTDFVLA